MGPKDREAHRKQGSKHPNYNPDLGYTPDTYENRVDPNQSEREYDYENAREEHPGRPGGD